MWFTVLAGAAGCYALKYLGAAIPESFLENPLVKRIVMLLPISLLCALVVVQTFGSSKGLTIDARVPAVGVASLVLWRKGSFILVVLSAAITAGLLRHFGIAQ